MLNFFSAKSSVWIYAMVQEIIPQKLDKVIIICSYNIDLVSFAFVHVLLETLLICYSIFFFQTVGTHDTLYIYWKRFQQQITNTGHHVYIQVFFMLQLYWYNSITNYFSNCIVAEDYWQNLEPATSWCYCYSLFPQLGISCILPINNNYSSSLTTLILFLQRGNFPVGCS